MDRTTTTSTTSPALKGAATPGARRPAPRPSLARLLALAPLLLALGAPAPIRADDHVISSASEIDYPPFCFVNEDGQADGFSVELLRAALTSMGRDVSFHIGSWPEVRGMLERGEIDALPLVGRTPEREPLFDFTIPYMALHGVIVIRRDTTDIQDLDDLKGRIVAVMQGDNAEEFLRRENRGAIIQTTTTFEIALQELAQGRYDAVVMQRLVALRLVAELGLTNLRALERPIEDFRQDFCFAVPKGHAQTLALLNEGLAIVMADGTYRRLHSKWFAALELPTDRPLIVGGDHDYPPFEYLDERGIPAGYNVDLTWAIAREMGFDIEIRLGPWADRVDQLESGAIDVLQGMFYTPQRDLKFAFSQPHAVNHYVGVARKGEGMLPRAPEDLASRRIVLQRGDVILESIREHVQDEQLTFVDSQRDVLRELAQGQHDCAVVLRLSALAFIEQYGWTNLELGRQPFAVFEYCYATRNDQRALLAQFSEGLKVLEESGEYRQIHDKWLGVYPDAGPPTFLVALRYSAIALIPLALILLVVVLWSWSLRRQVAEKTRDLRESLDRFQYVFEAANVGKALTLPTGEVHPNQAYADFLGYRREELTGKRWQDLTPPEDVPDIERRIAPLLRGEQDATRFEKRYVRKDGAVVWADVSTRIRRDAQGRPLHFITTIVDITQRKQAKADLADEAGRRHLLMEQSKDGIVIIDQDGQVVESNRKFAEMLGYPFESMGQLNVRDWDYNIPPEDLSEMFQIVDEKGDHFETRHRRRDGSTYDVEISTNAAWFAGQKRILCICRDITERKQAEQERERLHNQLLQAQKMESVGQLAGGVAHDFNNILQAMLGYSEMLLDQLPPQEEAYEYAREIANGVDRASALTRQLLAFARKQTIHPVALDFNNAITSMLKMLRRLIGEDIDLVWRPQSQLWAVKMDPGQLDQILANLCVNARDAIGGVGQVIIETGNRTFDAAYCANHAGAKPGDFVMLAVTDDGCGMDRETCAKIFEPFYTTKHVHEGTGLGLSTAYGIVKQNNGYINVYSEPGEGTTFRIYLPRHEGELAPSKLPKKSAYPLGQNETILLVEDDAAILALGDQMLTNLGYNVLPAATLAEALAHVQRHDGGIDLLLTDVVMPEMNGRQLSEQLGALCPHLKTLYMSGYTANVIAHRGVLETGVHFLNKPFSTESLAIKVREALEGEGEGEGEG